MSKVERVVMMAVSLIGCVAAVVVIPEVRCAAGLDAAHQCSETGNVSTLLPPPVASLMAVPREDGRIDPIRQRFNWIENSGQITKFQPVALGWRGADSASITVYTDHQGVAKIMARVYNGRQRNVLKFYYTGSSLRFMHQVLQNLHPESNQYEQRFYFDGGQMFRWLAPDRQAVLNSSPEFATSSQELSRLGADLLDYARKLPRTRA